MTPHEPVQRQDHCLTHTALCTQEEVFILTMHIHFSLWVLESSRIEQPVAFLPGPVIEVLFITSSGKV